MAERLQGRPESEPSGRVLEQRAQAADCELSGLGKHVQQLVDIRLGQRHKTTGHPVAQRRNHHRNGQHHDHNAQHDNQRVCRDCAGEHVAAGEQADDDQHGEVHGVIHHERGAHDCGRLGVAIAGFAQELQVDERGAHAGWHGYGGEAACHLAHEDAHIVTLVPRHQGTERNRRADPAADTERERHHRHQRVGVGQRGDDLLGLQLGEDHDHGHDDQQHGDHRTPGESGQRHRFGGFHRLLVSQRGDTTPQALEQLLVPGFQRARGGGDRDLLNERGQGRQSRVSPRLAGGLHRRFHADQRGEQH